MLVDDLSGLQITDGSNPAVDDGQALPVDISTSSIAPDRSPIAAAAAREKSTLYIGTFQVLAIPFSPGQLPPNFATSPSIIPTPSNKD